MHELPITQSILEIAVRHAEKAGAKRIVSINLVIGQLATAVDESIQFYWDMLSEGTNAKGARLNFQRVPTEMRCMECGNSFYPAEESFECPKCNSSYVRVIKGEELRVDSIDIE